MLESRHLVNKPQITVRKTIAPNSNSITQERFHSTKKKKNTARAPRMAKPTIESEKTVRDHLEGLESSVYATRLMIIHYLLKYSGYGLCIVGAPDMC